MNFSNANTCGVKKCISTSKLSWFGFKGINSLETEYPYCQPSHHCPGLINLQYAKTRGKMVYFEWCHCTKTEVSYDMHWMTFWMVFQVMWPSLPTLCLRRWCSNWGWWYWWMKTAEWKSQEWTERTQSTCILPPGLVLLAPTLIPFQQLERGPSSDQILGPSKWR